MRYYLLLALVLLFFSINHELNLHKKSTLRKVLIQANIFEFLQSKDGENTLVGEGGIQISGGQKQRIAIARHRQRCGDVVERGGAADLVGDDQLGDAVRRIAGVRAAAPRPGATITHGRSIVCISEYRIQNVYSLHRHS